MPDQSANLTNMRADGWWHACYASTITEVSVREGTLTADAAEPFTSVSYTGTSGSAASVQSGMEIEFFRAGVSLGRGRVADGGASANVLQVNEMSVGRVNLLTGDTFKVYRSFRLRDLLVSNDGNYNKDSRIAYSNQNATIKPIANTGGVWAGWTDDLTETGEATVYHYGSLSYNLDPDSGSSGTHLWDVKDGTNGGSATDADIVATYPVGSRVIDYTYTDSSNSATAVKRNLVRVHDPVTDPPIEIKSVTVTLDRNGDSRATCEVTDGASVTELPDGALFILWTDNYRFAQRYAIGSNKVGSRSHILFVGFLDAGSIVIDPINDTLTFDVISPIQRLLQFTGFSQVLEEAATPASWQEYEDLSVEQMAVYLLRWHTSLLDSFDFLWSVGTNYPFGDWALQQSTPGEQVKEVVASVSALFTCDRMGNFEVNRNLQRATSAERSAAATTIALTDDDILNLEWQDVYRYDVAQMEGRAFTTGGDPLLSVAPGEAPAEARDYTPVERLIVVDQTELNNITGWAWAEANSLYNGLPVPRGLQLTLPTSYDVADPAYAEYITITLASTTNRRERSFSARKFILQRAEISILDNGCKEVRWTLDAETQGYAGTTRDVIIEDTPPGDGGDPPQLGGNPDPLSRGTATLAIFSGDNATQQTGNFLNAAPNYTEYALTVTGTISDFTVDAFSPGYIGGGTAVNGVLATEQQVRRISDIFGARTLGSAHTFASSGSGITTQMNFERGVQNWGVLVHTGGFGCHAAYTTNGTSWTDVILSAFYDTFGTEWHAGIAVSPHIAGRAYTSDMLATGDSTSGSPPAGELKVTNTYGASWSSLGISCGSMRAGAICVPYSSIAFDTIFHGYHGTTDTTDHRLYRSIVGGASTDISPSSGGDVYGVDNNPHNRCIAVCDTDPNTLVAVLTNAVESKRGLFLTRNAMATTPIWTTLIEPVAIASFPYVGVYVVDRDLFYLFGAEVGLISNGATVVDKTGNLSIGGGTVRGLCGG
jgi:hypothetical protein